VPLPLRFLTRCVGFRRLASTGRRAKACASMAPLFVAAFRQGIGAQSVLPAIHPLGPIVARSADTLRNIVGIRVLSDGQVLVNDQGAKAIVLFDSTLRRARAVIDTSHDAATRYPIAQRPGLLATPRLFAYKGSDSTLFVDPVAEAVGVMDPSGRIARIMSLQPISFGAGSPPSNIRSDARGRIVYVGLLPQARVVGPDGTRQIVVPDSSLLLRADPTTHTIDTLTYLHIARHYPPRVEVDPSGARRSVPVMNPLPIADGWAVLRDGSVAVVRAHDFHIDWFGADGSQSSSPALVHEWRRLTDSLKALLLDSVARYDSVHPNVSIDVQSGVRTAIVPGLPAASELPDFEAPFADVRADDDGNLWVEESADRTVWDLVNRNGSIFERVRIPGGTSLEWLGSGVAYLSSREGTGTTLVRVLIH